MLHLEPRNDLAAALRFFNRRRWLRRVLRLGLPYPHTLSNRLPYAELVWMPFYLITYRVTSRRGTGTTDVSVDAYLGAFGVFQMHANLLDEPVEGEIFPPHMAEDEAITFGRKRLLETIMFRRGHRNKPVPGEAENITVFYYPFYVYYYERRRGKLDIRVFDAVRGENPGSKTKGSILRAMVHSRTATADQGPY
jgi:hypothetical protein